MRPMVFTSDAGQVGKVVVQRVVINVVNVVTTRDRSVGVDPDLLVEPPSALLAVGDAGYVVRPFGPRLGVGVAPVSHALEYDHIHNGHMDIVSASITRRRPV